MTASRHTCIQVSPQSLNHTLTSSTESDKPSQCLSPTATQPLGSMLEAPELILLPAPKDASFTSPSGTNPSSTSCLTNSEYMSLAGQILVRFDCQLRPQLPISYNKTTLRYFNGRAQVQTFNTLSKPLSDEDHPAPQIIAQDGEATSITDSVTNKPPTMYNSGRPDKEAKNQQQLQKEAKQR